MTDLTNSKPNPSTEKRKRGGMSAGSIFLLGSIALIGFVIALALMRQNEIQPQEGPAPDFTITSFDGETYTLSDFRGKIVVLNFWASWCAVCRAEAPDMETAWRDFKDDGVAFIGIAYADNGPSSIAFLEEFNITYINAPDIGTRISEAYNIQGVPETFIIDPSGNIVDFIYGRVTYQKLESIFSRLKDEGA